MCANTNSGSRGSRLLIPGIILSLLCWSILSSAQQKEKPKLKDFGASLKRIRWDPAKRTAIEIKERKTSSSASSDLDVVRVETDLVVFDAQVRDRQGRVLTGLTRDDFVVTEDGQPQTIAHFSLGNDLTVSRSIVLILDYSGSLRQYMDQSIDAAKVLIGQLGPKDRMAIVTDDVKLLVDFTTDAKQLTKALESLRQKARDGHYGRSFQLTALLAAVRELFDREDIRPIVIFQTDGDEVGLLQPPDPRFYFLPIIPANGDDETKKLFDKYGGLIRKDVKSSYKPYDLKYLYRAVEKSRATVYTIIPGQQLAGLTSEQQYARIKNTLTGGYSEEQIREITECSVRAQTTATTIAITSGGWAAFLARPDQAADIYATILSDINSRYVIGYYPTNKIHDGRRRTVAVEVGGHPDYVLSGRRSYYAPEPEP